MSELTASDLIVPNGPIDPQLFPGEEARAVSARIQAYIDKGKLDPRIVSSGKTGDDLNPLLDAYARWAAFRDVFIGMSARPINVARTDKGSSGYSQAQIQAMKDLSDEAQGELDNLLDAGVFASPIPETMSVKLQISDYPGKVRP